MLEIARAYAAAGYSVLPIANDGSKKPLVKWQDFIQRHATEQELSAWFNNKVTNIAVIGGEVSNNLEILDFDDTLAFDEFRSIVNSSKRMQAIGAKCPVAQTPSGGYHIYYRVKGKVPGNKVLARDTQRQVRIETRGEGGYAIVAPSTNYVERHLSILDAPVLTWEERELLHSSAYGLNQYIEADKVEHHEAYTGDVVRPGDDFNNRGDITQLLVDAGWSVVGKRGEVILWRRPGKEGDGCSATQGVGGQNVFYVFSSNAEPFEPQQAYSYFSVYAKLAHAGDFAAAAKDLREQGYGEDSDGGNGTRVNPGGTEFEKIIPLSTHVLPQFPAEVLPEWLGEFVTAVAISTQTPVDMPALCALSAVSASVAKKFEVWPRADWGEPINLYSLVACPSGTRKSPVFKACMSPIYDYERRSNKALETLFDESADSIELLEEEISALKTKAKKADGDEKLDYLARIKELREELGTARNEAPKQVRITSDDTTPEGLARLLGEQGGRIAILSADKDPFAQMAGMYGVPGNMDVYLKGYSGEDLTVDRIGRPSDFVSRASITFGVTTQPDVLQGLTKKQGFRGRGLLARWIYSIPFVDIGNRDCDAPPTPANLSKTYATYLQTLFTWTDTRNDFDEIEPVAVFMEEDARRAFWQWADWIESSLRTNGELEDLPDWAGKLHGLTARFAGLLHVAWGVGAGKSQQELMETPISLANVERAIKVARYAMKHAKAAYSEMGADLCTARAKKILDWVVRSEATTFNRRMVQMYLPTTFNRADDLEEPLKLLQERGYIKPMGTQLKYNGAGRPPTTRYEVNPLVWQPENAVRDITVVQVPLEELE